MTLDEFQTAALRTANCRDLSYLAMKVTEEAGEVAGVIAKHIGQGHDFNLAKLQEELGDVLWAVAVLADRAGLLLDVVAKANVDKLLKRWPNGFIAGIPQK